MTLHGCILIKTIAHRFRHEFYQFSIHREIRKSLSQVDGFCFSRERTHYCKNGRAYIGKFAVEVHFSWQLAVGSWSRLVAGAVGPPSLKLRRAKQLAVGS